MPEIRGAPETAAGFILGSRELARARERRPRPIPKPDAPAASRWHPPNRTVGRAYLPARAPTSGAIDSIAWLGTV